MEAMYVKTMEMFALIFLIFIVSGSGIDVSDDDSIHDSFSEEDVKFLNQYEISKPEIITVDPDFFNRFGKLTFKPYLFTMKPEILPRFDDIKFVNDDNSLKSSSSSSSSISNSNNRKSNVNDKVSMYVTIITVVIFVKFILILSIYLRWRRQRQMNDAIAAVCATQVILAARRAAIEVEQQREREMREALITVTVADALLNARRREAQNDPGIVNPGYNPASQDEDTRPPDYFTLFPSNAKQISTETSQTTASTTATSTSTTATSTTTTNA